MSRPRKVRLALALNPEALKGAQVFLGLASPSDVVEAALLTLIAERGELKPGDRMFVNVAECGLAGVGRALAGGFHVSYAWRGRLKTIKPDSLPAGRLQRRLARRSSRHGRAALLLRCVSRTGTGDFSTDDLTVGRYYRVVGPTDEQGTVCVIDDSGEAYLYPPQLFEPMDCSTSSHELPRTTS